MTETAQKKLFQMAPDALVLANYRTDLGDLSRLRDHVAANGVQDPLIITKDGLIFQGTRRLAVSKELGLPTVPVLIADDLPIACDLIQYQPKTLELPLKPTELALLGMVLEDSDDERARRVRTANARAARTARKGSAVQHVKGVEKKVIIPLALGIGNRRTYELLFKLTTLAQDDNSPYHKEAVAALKHADEGSRSATRIAWERIAEARVRSGEGKTKITGLSKGSPAYQRRANNTAEQAWRTVHHLDVSAPGLAALDAELVRCGNTPQETEEMIATVRRAVNYLKNFETNLREQFKMHKDGPNPTGKKAA